MKMQGLPLNPNHTNASTTQHTGGTAWIMLIYGEKIPSTWRLMPKRIPSAVPSATPIVKPIRKRKIVIRTVERNFFPCMIINSFRTTCGIVGTTIGGKNRVSKYHSNRNNASPIAR